MLFFFSLSFIDIPLYYGDSLLLPPSLSWSFILHSPFYFSLVAILEIPCVEYVAQPLIIPSLFFFSHASFTPNTSTFYSQPRKS